MSEEDDMDDDSTLDSAPDETLVISPKRLIADQHNCLAEWFKDKQVIEQTEVSPGYFIGIRDEGPAEFFQFCVYSITSKKKTLLHEAMFLDSARIEAQSMMDRHRKWREKRRKQSPTPAQLATLFRNKIPIPLDLTFGQASDTIAAMMDGIESEIDEYTEKYPH